MAIWRRLLWLSWLCFCRFWFYSPAFLPGSFYKERMALCLPLSFGSFFSSSPLSFVNYVMVFCRTSWLILARFFEEVLGSVVALGMPWLLCICSWIFNFTRLTTLFSTISVVELSYQALCMTLLVMAWWLLLEVIPLLRFNSLFPFTFADSFAPGELTVVLWLCGRGLCSVGS